MTIHHDKLAYGRLAKTSEELSEAKLAEMLKKLNSADDEAPEEQSDGTANSTAKTEERKK